MVIPEVPAGYSAYIYATLTDESGVTVACLELNVESVKNLNE